MTDDRAPAWDLFISHASEDKDSFVRPLATELSRLGLRVWYDEFSLQLGDSISGSIDRGLADSGSGLVVLSNHFVAKPWPRRELAGLVAGQIGRGQSIIPIWYNISASDVLNFSPPLADRKAIVATEIPLPEVALRILEWAKPELHQAYQRRLAFEHWLENSEAEFKEVKIEDIDLNGPIRHEHLSIDIILSLRVIREALLEVFPVSWQITIDNFRRDMRPDRELLIWLNITGVYLTVMNEYELSYEERKALVSKLLAATSAPAQWELRDDSPAWERRAFELASFDGDPTNEGFASIKASGSKDSNLRIPGQS